MSPINSPIATLPLQSGKLKSYYLVTLHNDRLYSNMDNSLAPALRATTFRLPLLDWRHDTIAEIHCHPATVYRIYPNLFLYGTLSRPQFLPKGTSHALMSPLSTHWRNILNSNLGHNTKRILGRQSAIRRRERMDTRKSLGKVKGGVGGTLNPRGVMAKLYSICRALGEPLQKWKRV